MRETGYYWVLSGYDWTVAFYDSNVKLWAMVNMEISCTDKDFRKINEQKLINNIHEKKN